MLLMGRTEETGNGHLPLIGYNSKTPPISSPTPSNLRIVIWRRPVEETKEILSETQSLCTFLGRFQFNQPGYACWIRSQSQQSSMKKSCSSQGQQHLMSFSTIGIQTLDIQVNCSSHPQIQNVSALFCSPVKFLLVIHMAGKYLEAI